MSTLAAYTETWLAYIDRSSIQMSLEHAAVGQLTPGRASVFRSTTKQTE